MPALTHVQVELPILLPLLVQSGGAVHQIFQIRWSQVTQLEEKLSHLLSFLLCPLNFNFVVLEYTELIDNFVDDLLTVILTNCENPGRFPDS